MNNQTKWFIAIVFAATIFIPIFARMDAVTNPTLSPETKRWIVDNIQLKESKQRYLEDECGNGNQLSCEELKKTQKEIKELMDQLESSSL